MSAAGWPTRAIHDEVVARARAAGEALAGEGRAIDAARRLTAPALSALHEAGVLRLLVPRALGGAEVDMATALAAFEAIAERDGSAGWCAMISATTALISGLLPEPVARTIFEPPDAVAAGVFATLGRAVPVDDGWRLTGRWPFASGCSHATWCMVGALLEEAGALRPLHLVVPQAELTIHDTWDTLGLRGTGSHDIELVDAFVPAARGFVLAPARHTVAAYRPAFFGALAAGVAAVALGIARGAIDAVRARAHAHQARPGGPLPLGYREGVQLAVARAEARINAARAGLFHALDATIADGAGTGEASLSVRTRLRLATCHATAESAAAVTQVHEAVGGSAVYTASGLERRFRDVHTASQHGMVGPAVTALCGSVLLGVVNNVPTL